MTRLMLSADYLPFLSVIPWNIVLQWVNLLILTLLVKRFLYKPVMAMLEKRNAQLCSIYEDAEQLQERADEACIKYEAKLKGAKLEAESIIKNATSRAQLRGDQIVQEAEKMATDITKKTQKQLEQDKKKVMGEIKGEISGMAVDIAQKLMEREISASDHQQLIDSFINNVGDVK